MRNITEIGRKGFGAASIAKALRVKPRASKPRRVTYLAFDVASERKGGSYTVRVAIEGRKVLGECENAATGEPCAGFQHSGHCYHLGRVVTLLGKK